MMAGLSYVAGRSLTNNQLTDTLVKSRKLSVFVIPANAGIQSFQILIDSRFRWSDGLGDFLRVHQ